MAATIPSAQHLDEINHVNDGLENIELNETNKPTIIVSQAPVVQQGTPTFSNFGAYAFSFGGCTIFSVLFFFALNFYLGELGMNKCLLTLFSTHYNFSRYLFLCVNFF